ncbi:hypothetical protein BASA81_002593 [Batrachochytrium salamandrivorans]|nr:hypothetical protein BASA81_002593 [Batrachochytrium salamandrivorans]
MSFARAAVEMQALERRVAELERLVRGRDHELARHTVPAAPVLDFEKILRLVAQRENTKQEDAELAEFTDLHQSHTQGMNVVEAYGPEKTKQLISLLSQRLGGGAVVGVEQLRLAKGLYRETRAAELLPVRFYFERISPRELDAGTREEAAKCLNNVLFQNPELRDSLLGEVEQLTVYLREVAQVVRNAEQSSNFEARTLLLSLKALFQSSHGDEQVAKLLVQSGVMSALVERLADAFVEVMQGAEEEEALSLVSETFEGLARGNLLIDGFRLLFILANYAQEEMLTALLGNDGFAPLQGDELEQCELTVAGLGMGDRYVFVQTLVLLFDLPAHKSSLKDLGNFDQIKIRVANLLMFANRAPGFVQYLHRHKVGPKLVELFYRQSRLVLSPNAKPSHQEDLLPLILGLKTLIDSNEDFLLEFQEIFFSKLQPELDATEFTSKQEFDQEKERRHFAGKSVPDTPFGNCVALLTCYEENIKRMCGEFLYDLCDGNPDKVTKLVGFGHAAHLLAIKGGMIGQIMANQNRSGGGNGS